MKVEDVIRCQRLLRVARQGPLEPYLDDIVQSVSTIGYTPASFRDLLQGVIQFGELYRGADLLTRATCVPKT